MIHRETQIHIAIVHWIRTVSQSTLCLHVPNGGLRSKREAAKLKAMGVLAGVPDLVVIAEPPGVALGFLEVKCPGAYLSTAQKAFRAQVETMGIPYAVVHSIDETRAVFKEWLIRTRETPLAKTLDMCLNDERPPRIASLDGLTDKL